MSRLCRGARAGAALLTWRELAAAVMMMMVVAGVVAAVHVRNAASDAAAVQAEVDGWGGAAAGRVTQLLDPLPTVMRTLARALQYIPQRVARESWGDLTAPLVTALPYVSAFTMLDDVNASARTAWEANMTTEYGRRVVMLTFAPGATLMPPQDRYFPVAAVAGPAASALGPGRNTFDSPLRAAAILEALATGDVAASHGALLDARASHVFFMPVHWAGPGNATSVLGLTIEDSVAFGAAIDGIASEDMYFSVGEVQPDLTFTPLYEDGVPGSLSGVRAYSVDVPFLGSTLRVLASVSAGAAEGTRSARLTATLTWGGPIVAAVGVITLVLGALRLAAQAASTREALAAAAAARDSVMSFFFHELRNPLHAALGLLREAIDAGSGAKLAGPLDAAPRRDAGVEPAGLCSDGCGGGGGGGGGCVHNGSSCSSGSGGLCEVEQQLQRMSRVLDTTAAIAHEEDTSSSAEPVDVPALLRDVAQHHRLSPALGVSLSVAVPAAGLSLVSDTARVMLVLEGAMAHACGSATRAVSIAASALGDDHVVFVVAHDGAARVVGVEKGGGRGGSNAAAGARAGMRDLPPRVREVLAAQLGHAASASPGGTSYAMHGRSGGRGDAGTGFARAVASTHHGWYARALAVTAALGGHMGVADGDQLLPTRIWLLLPRVPTSTSRRAGLPSAARDDDAHTLSPPMSPASTSDAAAAPAPAAAVVVPVRAARRRALVVDDEAILRRLVGRMLERLGVPYDALEDGSEVAGALTPQHDLILLDIVMKRSDGAEVCAALRAAGVTIPIIAMTGNADPTSIGVFKRCGFDGILAKPFTQAELGMAMQHHAAAPPRAARARGERPFWSVFEARARIPAVPATAQLQQAAPTVGSTNVAVV